MAKLCCLCNFKCGYMLHKNKVPISAVLVLSEEATNVEMARARRATGCARTGGQ
jgi:hypothetical protein